MKVLILASFEGNTGDIFSFSSFESLVLDALQTNIELTHAEMRDFYKNSQKRYFDTEFLHEINGHDMFVIGGGLYFDVRWDYSHTGTTLNFSDDFIKGIKVPVLLNGLGYAEPNNADENDPVQKGIFKKFERFISNVSGLDNWFLTVRNDGSMERIAARFGKDFAGLFKEVPDNGFYFYKDIAPYTFDEEMPTVGFSVANDTFTADRTAAEKVNHLNDGVAQIVQSLVSKGMRIVFFPHMPRDIDAIYQIMQRVGVEGFRKNVVIAPYNPSGINAAKTIVSYYKSCDIVVTMRFHANVIALQNQIPLIGLVAKGIVSGERIVSLYEKIQMSDYVLTTDENDPHFVNRLIDKINYILSNREECVAQERAAMEMIVRHRTEYCGTLRAFYMNQVSRD